MSKQTYYTDPMQGWTPMTKAMSEEHPHGGTTNIFVIEHKGTVVAAMEPDGRGWSFIIRTDLPEDVIEAAQEQAEEVFPHSGEATNEQIATYGKALRDAIDAAIS